MADNLHTPPMKSPATTIPEVILNTTSDCRTLPVIGMGTAVDKRHRDVTEMKVAIIEAIKVGYRHFDTAPLYRSEQPLGEAIVEALKLGLIESRKELFITSKLWCTDAHPNLVVPALRKSLRNLQLEYLDLYLIHWPISIKPGEITFPVNKEDLLQMDFKSVWAAMEECEKLGLTKSIGVSNFSCKKLTNLLAHATIPPSVNQVEMSPVWEQKKLREFCSAHNIVVMVYAPLGAVGQIWGTNQVMDCQVLKDIARDRGKTVAQVAVYDLLLHMVTLRWVYEKGATLLVRSFNKERMKENLSIFDWELTEDDYSKINKIEQRRGMPKPEFVSDNGPFKSFEELWDGEM